MAYLADRFSLKEVIMGVYEMTLCKRIYAFSEPLSTCVIIYCITNIA